MNEQHSAVPTEKVVGAKTGYRGQRPEYVRNPDRSRDPPTGEELEALKVSVADHDKRRIAGREDMAQGTGGKAVTDHIPSTEDLLQRIWEQACQGLFTEHGDCPATFACSAILTELTDLGYCGNCFGRDEACKEANKRQKKCCPDCTHE